MPPSLREMQLKNPTQSDVADLAGVSRTTVSFVLNNAEHFVIPDGTRQRVWDAVNELGYQPNRAAQSLRTQKTYTIASIITDITNPFHPAFLRGVQDIVSSHDYDLIMYGTDGLEANERKALDSVRQGRADGVVGSFFFNELDMFLPLLKRHVPIVRLGGRHYAATEYPLDTLFIDNAKASRKVVDYLADKGHQRIGLLTGEGPPSQDRFQGYREGLALHGIAFDQTIVEGKDFTVDEGLRAMNILLNQRPLPTALFATNDLLAIGAIKAITAAGLQVPDDFAIVAFDDIFAASIVTPALTTVALPQKALGQRAAELLFERILGSYQGPSRQIEFEVDIVIRESA